MAAGPGSSETPATTTTTSATPSATARAFDALKHDIMHATLGPGRQFLEAELAERLGMSRTPVREACIRLQAEGLVEVVPRRGIRVVAISADDMAQIYDLLATVEARAAVLAAGRVGEVEPDVGADAIVGALDAAVLAMGDALAAEDLDAWAEADARFHRALVEASGNRHLADTANRYADLVHRARLVTLRLRPRPIDSVADHRELVDAVRSGDADAASALHLAHRRRAAATLVGLLETFDPNGL